MVSDVLMPAAEEARRLRCLERGGPVLPGVGPVRIVPPPDAACRRGEVVGRCEWGRDCICGPERLAGAMAGG
jgi:hypothetical protein